MGVAKNAAKDIAGEAEQLVGAATKNEELEEKGQQKRTEAAAAEEREEAQDGSQSADYEKAKVAKGGMGVPNFNESTSLPVEDLPVPR